MLGKALGGFAARRLAGAVNLDYYSDTFHDFLAKLDRSGKYLVYCRSGARSRKTAGIMQELGFQEVYNLPGGINAWLAEGMALAGSG